MNLSPPVVCAPRRLCAPSFVRPVVCALLVSLILTAVSAVHAGTYVWQTRDATGKVTAQSPVYSGGTFTYTGSACGNNPIGQLLPFAFNSADGYYEDSISNGCVPDAQGNATTCSTTLTGTPLTVTFIWQPDYPGEPPPASVIVCQNGYASGHTAYSAGNCVITYMCNDGLGGSITSDGICKDTKWSVQSPAGDGSVSLTCTSSSAFTGNSGTVGRNGAPPCANGIVSLGYSANVYPVTINLNGATKDSSGNYNILVGQGCTASISGIPSGTGWTTTYSWSVSGPTFQTWQSQTPAIGSNPVNLDASYYVPGPGVLTNATAHWYWNETGRNSGKSETVTCTATVTPPTGQGSQFSVTAKQPVIVWSPDWTCTGTGGELDVTKVAAGSNGTDYYLSCVPTSTELQLGTSSRGMTWNATVNPPISPVSFGSGSLIVTQVILQLDRTWTTAQSQISDPYNGQSGLDTDYPYHWADGAPYYMSGDSPNTDLTYVYAVAATQDFTFEDYLMYFAPGSTQCVPLAHYTWTTNGTVSLPAGGWGVYPNPAGTVTDNGRTGTFLPANDFPIWTQIITATQ